MRTFEGKVAVVTGGASGIGRAMAGRFAKEGMKVVLADVEKPALHEAVVELESEGREVFGVVTDVTDPASVDELARATIDRFGTVHVVCNNAGVSGAATATTGQRASLGVDEPDVRPVRPYGVGHEVVRIQRASDREPRPFKAEI